MTGFVLSIGVVILMIANILAGSSGIVRQTAPIYRVVGYYTSYSVYNGRYLITDVPTNKLTHLNYAFVNLANDGACVVGDPTADIEYLYPGDSPSEPLRGNFKQLRQMKAANPSLQILMSIGGWTWSDHFSDAALTEAARTRFVQSCIFFMKRYGFDGIDIDWEFPVSGGLHPEHSRPEDKSNLTLLLAALRHQLDTESARDSTHYWLSAALPTDQELNNFELSKIHGYLDWLNLMTYTLPRNEQKTTGLLSPLYASGEAAPSQMSIDQIIQIYEAAGVPASKLVVGVGFFGYAWEGVPDRNDGLYQPFTRLSDTAIGDGVYSYADLSSTYLKEFTRYWNPVAQVPWLFGSAAHKMISYEDPQSLQAKVGYIKTHGLGGVMVWELGYDDTQHSLLNAISTP